VIRLANPLAQFQARAIEIRTAMTRVLDSGIYVLGPEVEGFECGFAAYCGVTHAVGVASGTDALMLALKALDVGPGDEVITVSHTAVATAAAILATGATPVLIDIEPNYFTLDSQRIEAAVTPRSRAIIAVHLYGQAAAMDAICAIAHRHGLKVVEDCAQSAGGSYRGRRLGSIGDVGCFSFYPTKNLGAIGDGGMVTTSDAALALRLRRLRQYGWNETRETDVVGMNSRLDPLQAAILGAKLPHLETDNTRRAAVAACYAEGLAGLPLTVPAVRKECAHVYHLYVIVCDERDAVVEHLHRHGVGCGIHYPVPIHLQKGYAERVCVPDRDLKVTEHLVRRIVSLPIYPELGDAEVQRVIAVMRDFYRV
jgi:dTDP-4-amino-4,6-dideoxygalactose transaminase